MPAGSAPLLSNLALAGPGELRIIGDSHTGWAGARSGDETWPALVAALFGIELEDRHVDGTVIGYDDLTSTGDGGWATFGKIVLPTLYQSAPYIGQQPATILAGGFNDAIQGDPGAAGTYLTIKASLRGIAGLHRLGAYFAHTHASVRKTGTGEAGVGSWATQTVTTDTSLLGTFARTTAVTDEIHVDVPADYNTAAVWLFYRNMGGTAKAAGNGAVVGYNVDGGAGSTFDLKDRYIELAAGARSNIIGIRIPIAAAGAHELNLTHSSIRTSIDFMGWGIEAVNPPPLGILQRFRPVDYSAFAGYPYVSNITDSAFITPLRTALSEFCAEFTDGTVYTVADGADAVLAKAAANFGTDKLHPNALGAEIIGAYAASDWLRKTPRCLRPGLAARRKRASPVQRSPWKIAVRAATTPAGGNLTLTTPPSTLDGITLAPKDRILVKNQTNTNENGIYIWNGGAPPLIRDYDANTMEKLQDGATVFVREGTEQGGSWWSQDFTLTVPGSIGGAASPAGSESLGYGFYRGPSTAGKNGAVQDIAKSHYFVSDAAIAIGDVLILSTGTAGRVGPTTTANSPNVIGVALTSTSAAGQAVEVALVGSVISVNKTNPALTAGNLVATSTTSGKVAVATSTNAAVLGKAIQSVLINTTTVFILITLS